MQLRVSYASNKNYDQLIMIYHLRTFWGRINCRIKSNHDNTNKNYSENDNSCSLSTLAKVMFLQEKISCGYHAKNYVCVCACIYIYLVIIHPVKWGSQSSSDIEYIPQCPKLFT